MLQVKIDNYWNKRSSGYSGQVKKELSSFKKKAWKDLIKKYCKMPAGLKALDIGTGPGFFPIILSELGFYVAAVDSAECMLEEARANSIAAGIAVDFSQGNAADLHFDNNSFDLIISRNLVWTLPDPFRAYKEWHRILKTGGLALVFDGNWFYRLHDPVYMEKYQQSKKVAVRLGITDTVSPEKSRECENIAKTLPLTYQLRPAWDLDTLKDIGFNKVTAEINIGDQVYRWQEKVLHSYASFFLVSGKKDY